MRRLTSYVLSSVSLVAIAASPAFGQAAVPADAIPEETLEGEQVPPSSTPTNAEGQPVDEGAIVITGSRIRRDNYSTAQNVDVLTRNDEVLAGTRTVAETLQSGTVTSGTSQISGSFLGFLSENGQAANVVGLRGLGATRTLVLLNGRRLAPAGAGNQLVAPDLNVLPLSVVQRIEILREGASSIYGSDAIAGVINVITDTELDGFTVDGFVDVPTEHGSGQSYRMSVAGGKTFSRGHILGSLEYREDTGMQLGDNPDWRCPRELAYVNGQEVGQGSPGDPNELRCFPFARDSLGTARGYGIYVSYPAFFGLANIPVVGRVAPNGYVNGTPNLDGPPINVDNLNIRPLASPMEYENTVISPIKTYTAYMNGSYELGALGNAELYGEGLFTRRKSKQQGNTQLNFQRITNGGFYGEAQLYGGDIAAYQLCTSTAQVANPNGIFGCDQSPFFPTAWAPTISYFGPFIEPNRTLASRQKVDYFRGNVGIRGDLGLSDWRYDANAMISRTRSRDVNQLATVTAVNNVLVAVAAPDGTPEEFITRSLATQVGGAGTPYTCASNITDGAYNGGECVPINFFDPNVFYNGAIPDALYDYLYTEHTGKTKYNQETFNVIFDGSLFQLPGGMAKAAVGFEHRRDKIDDIPSEARQNAELYGFSTVGRTQGSDRVNEVFGEVQLPLFADRPWLRLLEVNGSVRYTKYKSYGSDVTYALGGQWAPNDIIRFRGNYGTNFRAPNLYEQFVGNEQGFYGGGIDPCDDFANAYDPSNVIYQRCLTELTAVFNGNQARALQYFTTGSVEVFTSGGGDLEAETAKTWGFGTVITMPKEVMDLSLAVDYWNVRVDDQVSLLGNLIVTFCYQGGPDGTLPFPNNPYCEFIGLSPNGLGVIRNPGTATTQPGEIVSFFNPYLNISKQVARGVDFDMRYATRLFGGRFQTQLQATRNIDQQTEFFSGTGLNEFNGQLGYPGAGAGPKWVGSLDTRFITSNDITFRWGIEYVGPADDDPSPFFIGGQEAQYDSAAEAYWEHGVSMQWLWNDVGQFTLGVNNLFDAKPPTISSHPNLSGDVRIGNFFANGPYSYRGRSLFVNVSRSFK